MRRRLNVIVVSLRAAGVVAMGLYASTKSEKSLA